VGPFLSHSVYILQQRRSVLWATFEKKIKKSQQHVFNRIVLCISAVSIWSDDHIGYLLREVVAVMVNLGHRTGSPKSAEHVTSVLSTASAVVCQVAVFVPDSTLDPLCAIFIGMLAFPHTDTSQVNVTGSFPDADSGWTLHFGDEAALIITQLYTA